MGRDHAPEVANNDLPGELFTFYSDPTGGWLFVPWKTLHAARVSPSEFSELSYADMDGAYLDEVVDFVLFEILFTQRMHKRIVMHDVMEDVSLVRSKKPLTEFEWQPIMEEIANGFI